MPTARAVIFDLDGLMFNTEELYQEVGAELLRRRGYLFTQELLDQMMGRPSHVALQIMIDTHTLKATVEELLAIAKHNLGVLMIADKDKIDDLAVYIQYMNAPRGRIRSRRFSRTDTLIRALPRVTAQLSGIWGGRDAGAHPYLDERKRVLDEIQPGLRFEIIPGAGHWVAYEAADRFNPVLAEIAGS